MKNRAHVRGLAIIAITLAAALSACGSTSSTTSGQKNNPSASSSNAASQDANLIFAQCMREKGFDVPDTGLTPDNAKDTSAGFNAAVNECMAKTDGLTGQDDLTKDPAARDALVKGAQCLRDLGYNVKDPEPGKGVDIQDVPQDALNKCFGNPGGSK
ncbi:MULTISPECIES: hypothetical protein [Actinomycetaceae]|uniref:hypothetical protein n=1 Tax=Actinomycetaceae TaxID=2049 RepID=UPI0001F143CE|nr:MULTISPECIES: hypothetical protein [Actinomycetaceae]EFU61758.1 conserved hypothetical protein [Actinomyces sp. oral taxon 180 str. F0310]UUO93876.1 hypothetical protein NQK35_01815 [Schaalia odontolytica]